MKPKAIVQAWVEAFHRGNADQLAAFYTEDAVNHRVAEAILEWRDPLGLRGYRHKLSFLRPHGLPVG